MSLPTDLESSNGANWLRYLEANLESSRGGNFHRGRKSFGKAQQAVWKDSIREGGEREEDNY
jgi:hypothetical protein